MHLYHSTTKVPVFDLRPLFQENNWVVKKGLVVG
jgi:hypothetical protein